MVERSELPDAVALSIYHIYQSIKIVPTNRVELLPAAYETAMLTNYNTSEVCWSTTRAANKEQFSYC